MMDKPASRLIPEKWRWSIATALDRLPSFCWSSLVDWVRNEDRDEHKLRWARNWRCIDERSGFDYSGACYCGKRRTADADAVMRSGDCPAKPGVIIPRQR